MKRQPDHTDESDGDRPPPRPPKHPRLAATPSASTSHSTMADVPATPPASSGEVPPSTPSPTRKLSCGSGTFNPQRSPTNTIKIQGLNGCTAVLKGKGKLGSPSGIGMGNAKGLDGKGGLAKGGFGSGFIGRTNETKKLVVKNASNRTNGTSGAPSEAYISNGLLTLTRSIRAITAVPPERTPESLQTLYGLCEGLVAQGPSTSQTLYDRVRIELERRAGEIHRTVSSPPSVDASAAPEETDERWLARLNVEWMRWTEQILMIRSVFLHLDRAFVLGQPSLLPIWDLGLDIFRHTVVESSATAARLTRTILDMFHLDRTGTSIPRSLLHSILTQLHSLSSHSHSSLFLTPFFSASTDFYSLEGARLLSEGIPIGGKRGAHSYLGHIVSRLEEEGERCESVMAPSTVPSVKASVLRTVEEQLVSEHVDEILERGLAPLLDDFPDPSIAAPAVRAASVGLGLESNTSAFGETDPSSAGLATLYTLFSRTSSLPALRKAYLAWHKASGHALVKDPARDEAMVESLIAYKRKVDAVTEGPFRGDPEFGYAVKEGFEWFINQRENKPAEMIAKFLDAKLRVGNKGMTESELEDALNHVLVLFRYTQGKDVFEAFYKRDLGKRLLLGKSASADAERSMLLKLKDECGPGFTVKLETMFKDIDVSSDIMKAYKTTRGVDDAFDLNVSVLTTGNWPPYPQGDLHIPQDMLSVLDRFKSFYMSKHSGRKLTWAHALDHCVLAAKFPKGGKKELVVSLHQALVLLLFNELPKDGKLGFNDIVAQTGLDSKEAARTLQSLACGKVRVLAKNPKGKDVNPDDEFAFNLAFKDDHFRIKINTIVQSKETTEENKATTERIFFDRSSHLQLAIVRVMKSRKSMKHSELVMEVVAQIGKRFKCEQKDIKIAIESLISREYMERVEGTRDQYHYLA